MTTASPLFFAIALVAASAALAEGELEQGTDPYLDDSGAFAGGGNNNGFVVKDGSAWQQVCSEAFDPSGFNVSFSSLEPDGSLLVGGIPGVARSDDLGCSFSFAPELAGTPVTALGKAGGTLFTATEDAGGQSGIWMSTDGGDHWTVARAAEDGLIITELVASADGQRIAASGSHRLGDGTFAPAVLVATVGGPFADVSPPFASFTRVRAASFDVDDVAVLLGGYDADGNGVVLRASDPYDAPELLGTFPSDVRHIAVLDGARFALADLAEKTFRQGPGEATFTEIADRATGPSSCLFRKPSGDGLIGCGRQGSQQNAMFLESTDGVTWTPLLDFASVHFARCPAATSGGVACARFLTGPPSPPLPPRPASPAGCAGVGAGAPAFVLALCLCSLRRRNGSGGRQRE